MSHFPVYVLLCICPWASAEQPPHCGHQQDRTSFSTTWPPIPPSPLAPGISRLFIVLLYDIHMWCSDSLLLYTVYSSAQPVPLLLLLYAILQSYMLLCVTLLILLDKSAWCKESLNDTVWRSSHVYGAWVRCVLYCYVVQGSGRRIPVGKPRTHTATPLRHWNGVQGKPDENRDLYAGP